MYSEELRQIVQHRRNQGESFRKIAAFLNIKKSTVETILNYKRKANKKKCGPKPLIGKGDSLMLRRFISNCNSSGIKLNCNKLKTECNMEVSRRSLNNWILKEDYRYSKEVQKIHLTKDHKRKRIEIVSSWIKEKIDFKNCVFTDEKQFTLDGPNNRFTYAKQKSTINRIRRQAGGGGIMMWGLVLPNGLIALKKVEGHQTSEKYIDILRTFAVPLIKLNLKPGFGLVQDNSRTHTSKKVREYLSEQSLEAIRWPALSPDLNIIENVWKMLSDIVYEGRQPQNLLELKSRIENAVHHINMNRRETIINLFETFPDRMIKVLTMKGCTINN